MTAVTLPSVFTVPDISKTTSLRLPASLRLKIERIRELWKVVAETKGKSAEEIDAIDNTFVMVTLMGRQADEELQNFGGISKTDEQWAEQLKSLRDAAKAQAKKSSK
jgi:hypothetical protein